MTRIPPRHCRGIIDARGIWTGDAQRDAHLRSADFLDVEHHPEIRFAGRVTRLLGASESRSRRADNPRRHSPRRPRGPVPRAVDHALVGGRRGQGPEDPRRVRRDDAGSTGTTSASAEQSPRDGGVVVGDDVAITIDAEAILDPEG